MVVINNSYQEQTLQTARYSERLNGYKKGKEIISGKEISNLAQLTLKPKTAMIIELHN